MSVSRLEHRLTLGDGTPFGPLIVEATDELSIAVPQFSTGAATAFGRHVPAAAKLAMLFTPHRLATAGLGLIAALAAVLAAGFGWGPFARTAYVMVPLPPGAPAGATPQIVAVPAGGLFTGLALKPAGGGRAAIPGALLERGPTQEDIDHHQALLRQYGIAFPAVHYVMEIELGSPANLWLSDGSGRHTGADVHTKAAVAEVPDSLYTGPDTEPQLVLIPNPQDAYDLQLNATGNGGEYHLQVRLLEDAQIVQVLTGSAAIRKGENFSTKLILGNEDGRLWFGTVLLPGAAVSPPPETAPASAPEPQLSRNQTVRRVPPTATVTPPPTATSTPSPTATVTPRPTATAVPPSSGGGGGGGGTGSPSPAPSSSTNQTTTTTNTSSPSTSTNTITTSSPSSGSGKKPGPVHKVTGSLSK